MKESKAGVSGTGRKISRLVVFPIFQASKYICDRMKMYSGNKPVFNTLCANITTGSLKVQSNATLYNRNELYCAGDIFTAGKMGKGCYSSSSEAFYSQFFDRWVSGSRPRAADPDNKSPVLESFGYKQLMFEPVVGGGLFTAMSVPLIFNFGPVPVLILTTIVMLFWALIGLLYFGRKK